MKKINFFILPLLFLFFTGCLELSELTELRKNGSALFTLRVSVPEFPEQDRADGQKKGEDLEKEIEEAFKMPSIPGIKLVNKNENEAYGLNVFTLQVEAEKFNSLHKLYAEMQSRASKKSGSKEGKKNDEHREAFDQLFAKSEFKVKKTKNGTLQITRSFMPPKIKKMKPAKGEAANKEKIGENLEKVFLNMFRLRFEIMSPTEVISSNAPIRYGRDLRWETTLGYLFENPFEMQLEIQSTPEMAANLK